MGRSKNIQAIDFLPIRNGYRPNNRRVFSNCFKQTFSFEWREFFGIIESWSTESRGQYYGSSGHWTGQRASTRLIDTSDFEKSAAMEGEFEGKVRHGMPQKLFNLFRNVICELFNVPNICVEKTMPSESTTTPTPVWVHSLRMLYS